LGNDTIVINICDAGNPPICGLDTLVISVTEIPPVNEPPITVNEQIVLDEDTSFSGNMLDNGDTDPEGGILTVDTTSVIGPNNGTFVVDSLGNFTYTPNLNYNGTDTVIVQVCDDGSPVACSADTLIFTVNPINDVPTILNENVSISNNETATGNILDNDSDIDGSDLFVTELLLDANNGTFVFDSTGAYTYTPNACFVGIDTVIVLVCDSGIPLPSLCANDTLFFTLASPEIVANAGPDQTICGTSTVLNGVEVTTGATGVWSVISGTASITNTANPESIVTGLGNGENLLVWTVTYCGIEASDTVSITSNPLPAIPFAGEDQNVCGTEFTLQANTPSLGTGQWAEILGIDANIADVNASITTVVVSEQGFAYTFTWTTTLGNCSLVDTLVVNALIVPEPSILSEEQTVCINNPITLVASSAFGDTNQWAALTNGGTLSSTSDSLVTYTSNTVGENYIQLTVSFGTCSITVIDTITVLSASDSECQSGIFIPEGFSPNNDGANDLFIIRGADDRRISMLIFNRWGVLVYESENYQNDWDGRAYKGLTIDNQFLPESTYYYVIKIGPGLNAGEEEFKGYITLWR
jgi:gliding motility-associated-like protein